MTAMRLPPGSRRERVDAGRGRQCARDDIPGMPSSPADDITRLSPDDIRQGRNSEKFARRAKWLRERWCGLMQAVFDPAVGRRNRD